VVADFSYPYHHVQHDSDQTRLSSPLDGSQHHRPTRLIHLGFFFFSEEGGLFGGGRLVFLGGGGGVWGVWCGFVFFLVFFGGGGGGLTGVWFVFVWGGGCVFLLFSLGHDSVGEIVQGPAAQPGEMIVATLQGPTCENPEAICQQRRGVASASSDGNASSGEAPTSRFPRRALPEPTAADLVAAV